MPPAIEAADGRKVRGTCLISAAAWLVAGAPISATQERHTPDAWTQAVRAHHAGRPDESAIFVASWSESDLNSALDDVKRSIDRVKRQLDRNPEHFAEVNTTIRRAALLHADVAILLPARSNWQRRTTTTLTVRDGQVIGSDQPNVHWEFSRSLLDLLQPDPMSDGFARLWYEATSDWLIEEGRWSEAMPHLERARQLFPADARLALYLGVAHELFAEPRIQRAIATQPLGAGRSTVGTEDAELRQAVRYLQRALELDPSLTEASIRLSHVYILQERFREAASDLQRVLARTTSPILRYYALILLGRAHVGLREPIEARAFFEQALALVPTSQMAHLSLAQLSWDATARADALRHLEVLRAPLVESQRGDPWWVYFVTHVPSSSELLVQLRAMPVTGPPGGKRP
jgi:tetratricopeptide (TPR) repeat protein